MTDDTLPTLPRPASLSDHSIAPFVGQYSADQMRTYAAEAVRAALAAQVPQPAAVPDGWALVPVEPTPEMLYPDLQTAGPGTQLGDMCAGFGREIWARMLAASQESATTRGGVSRNAKLTCPPRAGHGSDDEHEER